MPPTAKLSSTASTTRHIDGASAARKAAFWDRIAHQYAADAIADMAGYEATLQRTQGLLTADDHVLEIGCGTGTTALHLAPFTNHLLATDVSARMIAIAREKLVLEGTRNLHFSVMEADADAGALCPGHGAYDAVLAFNLLHLMDDLDHGLAMAARALRPGGLLISKTPCLAEMNPLIAWLAVPLMRAIGKAPHVLFFNGDQLQSAITRQGLLVEAVERHGSRGKDTRVFIVARKPA